LKNFISHIHYQKDSQKTYKHLATIQNNTSCSNKVTIHENNDVITSDRGIANIFAYNFSREQKKGTYARREPKIVKGEYKTLKKNGSAKPTATEETSDSPISDCELQEAIKQLKNRKSPGEDQIHAEFLKHAGKEARISIRVWFQKIWETGIVPLLWKKATVVPILKTGKDPKSTASYRPISLTSTMGKSMERKINTRLNWLLETNIIANEQAGFRIHRSTSEHIAKFSQFIKNALDNKRILTAVFVDFKSAYDPVWKENLLLKLVRSENRSNLLQWLESFISHRSCEVCYGEYYSKYHILQIGPDRP